MADKEHELDRIAASLNMRIEVDAHPTQPTTLRYKLHPFPAVIAGKSKDEVLRHLRQIVGPDPALTQRIAVLEKEVEAAEKRGFEAAIKQVGDWALLGSTRDTLIRSGDILLKLDRMARDYKKQKSLKG